jgi:hypothetical protein
MDKFYIVRTGKDPYEIKWTHQSIDFAQGDVTFQQLTEHYFKYKHNDGFTCVEVQLYELVNGSYNLVNEQQSLKLKKRPRVINPPAFSDAGTKEENVSKIPKETSNPLTPSVFPNSYWGPSTYPTYSLTHGDPW